MAATEWNEMEVNSHSKYLGFMLGSGTNVINTYNKIIDKIKARLDSWPGHMFNMFDKIRVWNMFAMSMLGYVDQLYPFHETIGDSIDALLTKWIGGPNGWINPHILARLTKDLGFMISPRRHGMSNMAARGRTRHNLTPAGKLIIGQAINRPGGIHYDMFPSSVLWSLVRIDSTLEDKGLDRRQMAAAAQRTVGQAPFRLQQAMYARILTNWKVHYDPGRIEEQKCCIEVILRHRGETHYQLPINRSRALTRKWVRNFKMVSRVVAPRVSICLLRAGLHGWFTTYRFGERNTPCRLCHMQIDSLDHMSDCQVSRKLWRTVLPTIGFDKHALLGFVDQEHSVTIRVYIACILFVIHEFHRYLKFHEQPRRLNVDECVRAMLLHATGCFHDARNKHVKDFVQICVRANARR